MARSAPPPGETGDVLGWGWDRRVVVRVAGRRRRRPEQVVVQVVARRVVERHGARAIRLDPDVTVVVGGIAGHEAVRAVEESVGSDVDAVVVVAAGGGGGDRG